MESARLGSCVLVLTARRAGLAFLYCMVAGRWSAPAPSPPGLICSGRSIPSRRLDRSQQDHRIDQRSPNFGPALRPPLSPVTRDFPSAMCDLLRWPQPPPSGHPTGLGRHSPNRKGEPGRLLFTSQRLRTVSGRPGRGAGSTRLRVGPSSWLGSSVHVRDRRRKAPPKRG